MRVLITGSEGFIGTNLKKYLDSEYTLYCWDIKIGSDIFDERFEDAVKKVDIVVHLAALTSVAQSFKNPQEVMRTNVLGTARVVELCQKYKKKLIYPSSAAVLFPDLSPYAKSKWLAEEIVKSMKGDTVILRLFNVYGHYMNPDSGSVMYRFLNDKKLIVFGDGEQTRDYINVKDVCRVIEDAFKDKWNGKIVEIGTGHHYTANYIAGLFAHFRGLDIEYQPPQREIKWSIADTSLLKHLYKKKLVTDIPKDVEELCHT